MKATTKQSRSISKRKKTIATKQGDYIDLYSFDYDELYKDVLIDNDGDECLFIGLELVKIPPQMATECLPF